MKAVVIPCYNEEGTIAGVIEQVKRYSDIVIVVNDGSIDSSLDKCLKSHAVVIDVGENRGYDNAIKVGLDHAIKLGATLVATFDADGQHNPFLLMDLFEYVGSGEFRIAIGARRKHPRFSEALAGLLTKRLFRVEDITSGLKCYSREILQELIPGECPDSVGTCWVIYEMLNSRPVKVLNIDVNERHSDSRFGMGLKQELDIVRKISFAVVWCLRKART